MRAWKRKGERAPGTHLTLNPDLPTVGFHHAPGDREPEPDTATIAVSGLPEVVEKVLHVAWRDSRAGVAHLDEDALLLRGGLVDDGEST